MTIFNYTVNYIDVALCAVFLIFLIIGYNRGLLINVVNFIRWAVGLFLCFFLSENLNALIYENFVKEKALDYINESIVTSNNLDEILSNLQSFGDKLPPPIAKAVDFSSLSVSSENISEEILNNIFEPVLLFLIKAAIFIAVFLAFFIITGIIILLVKKASKRKEEKRGRKSSLKKVDKFLGALLGALKGALVVFAITSVLVLILDYADDKTSLSSFMQEVQNSSLLKLIDEINPFNAITGGLI